MNRVFPLVDGGLMQPKGIAYDKVRADLYVADLDARKIIQYKIKALVDKDTLQKSLTTYGAPTIVVEGTDVRWLTVDEEGNLYWTDQTSNSVNKLSHKIINMLQNRQMLASELKTVSEAQIEAEEAAA
jgi:sugar lactone lactonase YvrE